MSEEINQDEMQKRIDMIKENCIFCKIVDKKMDSKIIFEDETVIALLDINPATIGHVLLMPKEHYMLMPIIPDQILAHLNMIAKKFCDLLLNTFKESNDVTMYVANGAAAGQQTQHFMMHLIPRYENDGLDFNLTSKQGKMLSENEITELKNKLKDGLTHMNSNIQ